MFASCAAPLGPWGSSLVELTEEILKLLMELVFRLVRSGELSLARVLRKNILDKVDQKKLLRCTNSDQPLAARGVAARWAPTVCPAALGAPSGEVLAATAPVSLSAPLSRPHGPTCSSDRACDRVPQGQPRGSPRLGVFSRVVMCGPSHFNRKWGGRACVGVPGLGAGVPFRLWAAPSSFWC